MGYIRHRAAIAIFFREEDTRDLEGVRAEMKQHQNPELPDCILGPCKGVNGYLTYVFAPHGSKIGWETATVCERYRARFIEAARDHYADVIEVQVGGDDGESKILTSSDPAPGVKA